MNDEDIHIEMKKFGIHPDDYTIRDGMVDVEGDVCLNQYHTSIPVPFRSVSGDFLLMNSNISSLKNSPREVGCDFSCAATGISSLKYAPREVAGTFFCSRTNITSLVGSPDYVGIDFYCHETLVDSLDGAPKEIGRDLLCGGMFEYEPDHSHIILGGGIVWEEEEEYEDG